MDPKTVVGQIKGRHRTARRSQYSIAHAHHTVTSEQRGAGKGLCATGKIKTRPGRDGVDPVGAGAATIEVEHALLDLNLTALLQELNVACHRAGTRLEEGANILELVSCAIIESELAGRLLIGGAHPVVDGRCHTTEA